MIRKYHENDTDALISIWRAASALSHPFLTEEFLAQEAEDIREIYLPNAETWVTEEQGQPVGHIALAGDEIRGLFLDPSFHGKGLGRALVDHAVALKGPLRVEVFKENAIGRRFYERYGFVLVEEYLHQASGELSLKMAMPSA